jgi:hypothetical protein
MSNTLPPEVRTRVDGHLDAVESQLRAAGADRTQRRGIVDDLETQILDMLAAQKKESLGLADVDAVLARLDPPSAYSDKQTWPAEPHPAALASKSGEPRLCREVVRGAWCMVASVVGLSVLALSSTATTVHHGAPLPPPSFWHQVLLGSLLTVAAVAGIVGWIMATGLGWVAVERIRGSNGRLYGTGLAVIEALLLPLLIIWIGSYVVEYWFERTLFGFRGAMDLTIHERETLVTTRLIWIVCALALSAGLVWLLRWSSAPKGGGSRAVTHKGPASMLASSTNA